MQDLYDMLRPTVLYLITQNLLDRLASMVYLSGHAKPAWCSRVYSAPVLCTHACNGQLRCLLSLHEQVQKLDVPS